MVDSTRMRATVTVRIGWWDGPENTIDRLAYHGLDAREIAARLDIPRWVVAERFALLTLQGALAPEVAS